MATGARIPQKSRREAEAEPNTLSLEERIRVRAHEIWLRRAGQDGSDVEDWLQAENEIRRESENQ